MPDFPSSRGGFFSLLHMYIFRENKHYRAYRHLSNFSPCNSFFLMSGWMSSYTLHMCLLPWLRTVKGRGGRHNGAGLLLLLHSVERKSTSNTNGWMDYYKSKSSLIAIENDFILHLHLLKYFFCIFNSVFFYISIDPLRRLPAISSFHGRPPWMEGVGGRVGADCRAAGRGQRPRRCRHLVRSLVRSFFRS